MLFLETIGLWYSGCMQFDPQSAKTTGYHIFLEPENELRDEIQAIIDTLARAHGGPTFTPHVTLLARIPGNSDEEVITRSQKLAQEMNPFSVSFTHIETRPAYFQACFLRLAAEHSVMKYHEQAREVFGVENTKNYLPHMSLFYGNLTASESAQLLSEIRLPNRSLEFKVDKLHIYQTPGAVDDWKKIAEAPVSSSA